MIKLPQCALCRHFNAADRTRETCTAFPDGIPADILTNRFDHTRPHPGDAGIRFEGADEECTEMQAEIFVGRPLPVIPTPEPQTS